MTLAKPWCPCTSSTSPGRLTPAEFDAIKAHPSAGYESYLANQPGIDPQVLDAVRHHHEALDGSGYPDGLRGTQIGLLTRVLTVCDIFAALTEARAYKPARLPQEAVSVLVGMALDGKLDYCRSCANWRRSSICRRLKHWPKCGKT